MSFNESNNGGNPPPSWRQGEAGGLPDYNIKLIARIGVGVIALILVIALLFVAKGVYTDWLWFGQLGVLSLFKKILIMRIWLFFAGALLVAALLLANLYLAYRFSRGESVLPVPPEVFRLARIGVIGGVVLTVFIMSMVFGLIAQGRWETFLIFLNRVPFGIEDPQFNRDMSFHVAVMPMLHFIQGWLMGAVIAIMVAVAGLYLAIFALRGKKFSLTPKVRGHLAVLAALLMVTIAAAHYLDIFELLFSGRGAAPGAGYTDVNARIPVLWLLVAIALVSAVGFLVSLYYGGVRLMIASFTLWAVLAILAGAMYPVAFQRFRVNPDEFNKEETYIQRNLEATRAAYKLENILEQPFLYKPELTAKDIADNPQTIDNVRLWDPVPLTAVYNQVQFFELYYDFLGMDVDRYIIDGQYRQVMLAPRELSPEDLPEEAQRWVNRKLQYTHGYGVSMSPVTSTTEEGKPEFFLQDIPPVGEVSLEQPQVYYGENTTDFVIVNTNTDEFDFPGPQGGDPVYSEYQGGGGVPVGSFFRKLAYSWDLLDFNILISNQFTKDSRIMYRRTIQDRIGTVAPFLRLDSDPYLVVADGKLWWIQDAYTVTDRYGYSANAQEGFNYIRNSVKVVLNAFNGSLKFYVVEPDDPVIRMYQRAFPDLFEPVTRPDPFQAIQPEALRDHVRYPIDLFSVQTQLYLRYHMRDPQVFFNREDQWDVGNELFFNQPQKVKPYYVIMKLPGEVQEEFVLIMPFTPFNKPNMVAWMAARNDGPYYGQLQTFKFPTGGEDVSGTEQVEARITNDDTIRERLTLLCPEGTVLCIRGNLLVIPIGQSVLYVEPLFIRPVGLDFPQLKQVFVADGHSVVMADSLSEGLDLLVGKGVSVAAPDRTDGEPSAQGPPVSDDATREALQRVREELLLIHDVFEDMKGNLTTLEEALSKIDETLGGGSR